MITKSQLNILSCFVKNTFKEYTYKEIKESSKQKSNSLTQRALKKLLEQNIITERQIGTSKLYKINHENQKTHLFIELINFEKLEPEIKHSIIPLIKEINKKQTLFSIVIFGSYANNKVTENSDLDIAIITTEKSNDLEIAVNTAKHFALLELDVHIITESEMREMLRAEYANLGKEIKNKNLPVYNAESFYRILINEKSNE